MQQQNFKNHAQMVPLYHYVTSFLLLATLIGSVINLANTAKENLYSASLITALTIVVILVTYFTRSFALKAQDRAIRAEENFRHFLLTGKPLDAKISLSQIIALRFAADEEFAALAQKALLENLTNKQIKQLIVSWRADNNRL